MISGTHTLSSLEVTNSSTLHICKIAKNSAKKVYIEIFLHLKDKNNKNDHNYSSDLSLQGRTLGMADSGADVCAISYHHLKKLFKQDLKLLEENIKNTNATISAYNSSNIKLKGFITFELSFFSKDYTSPCHFFVIDDVNHQTKLHCPVILGLSALIYLNIDLSFYKINNATYPCVMRKYRNNKTEIKSFFLSEEDLNVVITRTETLQPKEARLMRIQLHDNYLYEPGTLCLVSNESVPKDICIVPTISKIENHNDNKYINATVYNFSNTPLSGDVNCYIEPINDTDYEILDINDENIPKICEFSCKHEVIQTDSQTDVIYNVLDQDLQNVDFQGLSDKEAINLSIPEPTINLINKDDFLDGATYYDPDAINNNSPNEKSLTDNRFPIKTSSCLNPKEIENFHKSDHINLNIQDVDDVQLRDHGGFQIFEKGYDHLQRMTASDVIDWDTYSPEVKPYIKDIFVDKYEEVVSKHGFDVGEVSYLLGMYHLRLKPNTRLPSQNKIYYLSQQDSKHLRDLLDFMLSKDIISEAPPSGDKDQVFACSAYLVPRKDKNAHSRLVVNSIPLNRVLMAEPAVIPTSSEIINSLRGNSYFSTTDIAGAFNSIKISPETRHLAKFITSHGVFQMNTLLTGALVSPAILHRFMNKILNYDLDRDKNGNIQWKEDGTALLKHSPLEGVKLFFDDIICYSKFDKNYKNSMKKHFEIVEKLIQRLHTFKCKVSLKKSEFFKSKLSFLGWQVSGHHLQCDPKRIQKILDFPLPSTTKEWKVVLGTVNSLRGPLGFTCLKNVSILAELTSEKVSPTDISPQQKAAFEDIKTQLCKGPIFSCLIDSSAKKIIYSDASNADSGSCGALLIQIIPPEKRILYVPPYLFMEDKNHVLIYEHKLKCVPTRFIKSKEEVKDFLKSTGIEFPPESSYLSEKDLGFKSIGYTCDMSLYLSLETLFSLHNMLPATPKLHDYCKKLADFIKKDILGAQIRDHFLKGSKDAFLSYLKDIKENKKIRIDPNLYIFEALSYILLRPITVISALKTHESNPIQTFRPELTRPPFYFLLYEVNTEIVSKCAFLDKSEVFDIKQLRGTFEVICYFCKTIPKSMRSYCILELECLALIYALSAFRKLIGTADCCAIVDNKALFWLFSSSIGMSADKIARWGHYITENFPQLQILFTKSEHNLADMLTRNFGVKTSSIKLSRLERKESTVSEEIWDLIDGKTFSIDQWKEFVAENSDLLVLPNKKTINMISKSSLQDPILNICNVSNSKLEFNKSFSHLVNLKETLDTLKDRISYDKIMEEQRLEYDELYQNLVQSTNFHLNDNNLEYNLINGVIYIKNNNKNKILVPTKLESILIAYHHVSQGHLGAKKLVLALDPYYKKGMISKAKIFAHCCLACLLNNPNTSVQKYAYFPAPDKTFSHIQVDFMTNLPLKQGYKHIVITTDLLSGTVLCFPLKTKQSEEFILAFIYSIFQIFKPRYMYMDNDQTFVSKVTLKHLSALGIEIAHSVSRNEFSHGVSESSIKKVEMLIRKYTVNDSEINWLHICPLLTLMLNTSKSPKHNLKPFQFLFGNNSLSDSYFNMLETDVTLHPIIRKSRTDIEKLNQEWTEALKDCAKQIDKDKTDRNLRINKNRKNKVFYEGQTVFVKRSQHHGVTSIYEKSPYKIIHVNETTALCVRLSDGFCTVMHFDWLKPFDNSANSIFNSLPQELFDICNKVDPDELTVENLRFLLRHDDFVVPPEITQFIGKDFETILRREFSNDNDNDQSNQPGTSGT